MENEILIFNKELENELLELIYSSTSSSDNVLLHKYYIDLINIGNS